MTISDFKTALLSEATQYGFDECEIYYGADKSFRAMIRDGSVEEYKSTESGGLSFRGLINGRMGYSYTEKIDAGIIPFLIESAAKNAEIIESAEKEKLFAGSPSYMEIPKRTINELPADTKIELAKRMEAHAKDIDPRVKNVLYCMISTGAGETFISNSLGLTLSHKDGYAAAYAMVQAEENGQSKTAGEFYLGHDLSGFNPEEIAKKAVEKALSCLGASPVESKKYRVLLNNLEAAEFFECFSGVFFAERIQKGFSLLKDKLSEKIADCCVTLRDDGVYEGSVGSVPFDSEGVATQNKTVIENGILKTYLYNLKSAEKDGAEPTGNGFKPSFRSPVGTACTNFYIEPSKTDLNAMIKLTGDGLYITELAGLHSGASAVSGNFSFMANGFLIENGAISRPVEQITIAGNFFEMLKNIEAVGSDLRFGSPGGGGCFGMPSVLVRELSVAGV